MATDQDQRQRVLESNARELAKRLDRTINPDGKRAYGFALLLFAFGDPPQPATWISNGERADMIRVLEEWVARLKTSPSKE